MTDPLNSEERVITEGLPVKSPPEQWRELFNRQTGKTNDCCLTDLFALANGTLEASKRPLLETHARFCRYCFSWRTALERAQHTQIDAPVSPFFRLWQNGRREVAVDQVVAHAHRFLAEVGLARKTKDRFQQYLLASAAQVDLDSPLLQQWLFNFATEVLGFPELPYEPTPAQWDKLLQETGLNQLLTTPSQASSTEAVLVAHKQPKETQEAGTPNSPFGFLIGSTIAAAIHHPKLPKPKE